MCFIFLVAWFLCSEIFQCTHYSLAAAMTTECILFLLFHDKSQHILLLEGLDKGEINSISLCVLNFMICKSHHIMQCVSFDFSDNFLPLDSLCFLLSFLSGCLVI